MKRTRPTSTGLVARVAEELAACIGCSECLLSCPALAEEVGVLELNAQTLAGPVSGPIARFARSCYQCGDCAAPRVCPVGLHRDDMMLLLKVRLLLSGSQERDACPTTTDHTAPADAVHATRGA